MEQILMGVAVILKLATLYFACVALFLLKKQKSWPEAEPKTNFAVVIAARNEERVIGDLVESILTQNYPAHLRRVFVVPNNCTDLTEAVSVAAGAEIISCLSPVRSKGDALHQALSQLMNQEFDAFVIFDADNVAHPDFLRRMNDAVCAGARVCKARQKVINPTESGVAGSYGLYFAAFDWFFNRPRAACGLSAKLVGTGFVVHREVLEALGGWNTSTIAEDAEFSAQCARAGWRICWVPRALTYDEAPAHFALSLRQRKRWCSGVMQVGRQELGRLWQGESRRPMLRLDMTMFLLAPFAQAISGLLMTAAMLLRGKEALLPMVMTMVFGYLVTALLGAALCLLGEYSLRGMGRTILFFPIFMASWLPLQILSLFKDTKQWHAIAHTGKKAAAGAR